MIFDLAQDFHDAVAAMPREHLKHRLLELLEEAIRRDIHFIARHPTALFQCLWNTCWWYDCPQAAWHYDPPPQRSGSRIDVMLELWRASKEEATPRFIWVRSLRPPAIRLFTAHRGIFRGHEGAVWSVAYSPDGRRIVSGGDDTTIRVWNVETGKEQLCLRGHTDRVWSAAFSSDGRRIISKSYDLTIREWDAEDGREIACQSSKVLWEDSTAYSPDRRWIVFGAGDGTVRVQEAKSGAGLYRFYGHEKRVWSAAFSPDSRSVVSGGDDKTVRVWDLLDTRYEFVTLRGHTHTHDVRAAVFSPDGRWIASCADDHTLRIWDAETGEQLGRPIYGHTGRVLCAAVSPDGHRLVSGSERPESAIRVWEADCGKELSLLEGHGSSVLSVAYSPDGKRIVSGSEDKTIRVWDPESGRELACLRGHEDWVWSVAFSPDGSRIISGGREQNKTVRIWDAVSGRQIACLRGHDVRVETEVYSPLVERVSYSPDGRLIYSAAGDKTVRIWDARSGTYIGHIEGKGDVAAIAAGATRFRWLGFVEDWETVIKSALTGESVAWFPATPEFIVTHPSGRAWVGAAGNRLYFFGLEGGEQSQSSAVPKSGESRPGIKTLVQERLLARNLWKRMLNKIREVFEQGKGLPFASKGHRSIPCLELPAEAWAESRLFSDCPHPLQLNPFFAAAGERKKAK